MDQVKTEQQGSCVSLAELHKALYSMLQEFHRVCQELNITYFLFAGTLLGAVRHKGFIPWDDDLDVLMPRKDYERLLKEGPNILDKERFFLQGEFSEHFPMFFSKLRMNGTTCLEKYHPKDNKCHQGIYIDIFPCDNAYDSKLGRIFQFACSKVVIAKGLYKRGYDSTNILKKILMFVCRPLPIGFFHNIVKGPEKTGKFVHSYLGAASKMGKSTFPASFFAEREEALFEEDSFFVPRQYDAVLKVLYGDYMAIPPEGDRKCKEHSILVDLTRSYEEYESYRDGMKFEMLTKSIR